MFLPGVLLRETTHDQQTLGCLPGLYFSRFTTGVNGDVAGAPSPPIS